MKNLCLVLLLITNFNFAYCQIENTEEHPEFSKNINFKSVQNDFNVEKPSLVQRLIPVALITSGVLLSTSDFEKALQSDVRNSVGNDFYTTVDDYFRYAPIVQMYTADMLGAKAKNHWFDQTKNMALSLAIANITSTLLKKEVYKLRPGGGTNANSFPSGHTTTAFATATVLYEEFKGSNPLLANSGYLFAAATGTLRMLNNAHYLSDVLVGAGIGILSAKLVYQFDNLIKWNPFKKEKGFAFAPQFSEEGFGFYFTRLF
ncbi:phosphatase PAP2 family protein [Aquimarina brevivitae]|uniref:PAP2 superfamily protein n=1 Tax=Aquimarina brevivitae TaxID=323412 RepID=A0A4Q7P0W2_9FLAO|nr:phosphatase PAP2 family protein [Aquimarina brevivitae]RZS93187.1 PAP2 superfamily protein [Aquimarina brevivitae]